MYFNGAIVLKSRKNYIFDMLLLKLMSTPKKINLSFLKSKRHKKLSHLAAVTKNFLNQLFYECR